VKIKVVWVGKTRDQAIQSLTDEFLKRIGRYADIDPIVLKDEAGLSKLAGREPAMLVVLDAAGKQLSSEELAEYIRNHQDRNPVPLIFAVGPADGFSGEIKRVAGMRLSLGRMTLAHELARVVLLEQIYRAFTILKGHPYHLGH
jgi:23S rRNA (pseudouridine1915-N3)-methyltransferase